MEFKKKPTNIFRPILLIGYTDINREIDMFFFQFFHLTLLLENDEEKKNRYMYFVYDTTSDDI